MKGLRCGPSNLQNHLDPDSLQKSTAALPAHTWNMVPALIHFRPIRLGIRLFLPILVCSVGAAGSFAWLMAAEPKKDKPADAAVEETAAPKVSPIAPPTLEKLREEPITDYDRKHWAFQPLVRPELPPVRDSAWVRTPVDRFVLARLEAAGLTPLPAADRATLLRRVTFDLTGLPPKPEELAAFLADNSGGAYERVVDRLLASAAYGEHWGQHWLDLARYADTDGFEHDNARPLAYKYRDWVIEALNRDLPYDEFVRRQIAGDELYPEDEQAAIATGFLLAGPDMPDLNLLEERRHNVLNEITSTVGAVFLGLTIGCAQCHDHKFDPISQADFYRLRAVFEPAELFKTPKLGRVVTEAGAKAKPSYVMVRGDFRRPGSLIEPAFPRISNARKDAVASPEKDAVTTGRRTALARWLTRPDHPQFTRVMANWIWQQHFGRGLCETPGDFGLMSTDPTDPELLDWLASELPRQDWSLKRMHKLLVTSAVYLTASRSKSAAWSAAESETAAKTLKLLREKDPDNKLLGRTSRRRLSGEEIRDGILTAGEQLSPRQGGPGVMPPLAKELLATIRGDHWKVSPDQEDHRRRSVYLFVRRNLREPLLEAFDRPDTIASCPRRNRSTTAPQALTMWNSEFSLTAARHLAGFLLAQVPENGDERIALCYRQTFGRSPTAAEVKSASEFLDRQSQLLRDEGRSAKKLALPEPMPDAADPYTAAAWTDFCLAMFNLNEFVYVD
jgi:hypothetical protein